MGRMQSEKTLSASQEDYLEAIFHIAREKKVARSKEIAQRLKVGSSSVTGALHALADRGLINYVPYGVVTLTPEGLEIAEDVVRRHEILREFFVKVLSVEEDIADQGACRMEHEVPRSILERFIQFVEFIEVCPRGGTSLLKGFGYHCDHGRTLEDCEECIDIALRDLKKRRSQLRRNGFAKSDLRSLKPGQKGKVVGLEGEGDFSRRMAEVGVTPGALIEVEEVESPHGPIHIKVKGYHISLNATEAATVTVELI